MMTSRTCSTVDRRRIATFDGTFTNLEDLRSFLMMTCADLDGLTDVEIRQSGSDQWLKTTITVHEQ